MSLTLLLLNLDEKSYIAAKKRTQVVEGSRGKFGVRGPSVHLRKKYHALVLARMAAEGNHTRAKVMGQLPEKGCTKVSTHAIFFVSACRKDC